MPREKALVVGSLSSGYVTGFLAASFEWAKVQRSLGATVGSVSARKRLAVCHGAGLRNAVFDATFFGTEHVARRYGNLPPEATYALGAVAAITLDFPLDVALKRNMAAPTTSPVPRVGATLLALDCPATAASKVVFAGLGVKSRVRRELRGNGLRFVDVVSMMLCVNFDIDTTACSLERRWSRISRKSKRREGRVGHRPDRRVRRCVEGGKPRHQILRINGQMLPDCPRRRSSSAR